MVKNSNPANSTDEQLIATILDGDISLSGCVAIRQLYYIYWFITTHRREFPIISKNQTNFCSILPAILTFLH